MTSFNTSDSPSKNQERITSIMTSNNPLNPYTNLEMENINEKDKCRIDDLTGLIICRNIDKSKTKNLIIFGGIAVLFIILIIAASIIVNIFP